jgi:hypothetical protein
MKSNRNKTEEYDNKLTVKLPHSDT